MNLGRVASNKCSKIDPFRPGCRSNIVSNISGVSPLASPPYARARESGVVIYSQTLFGGKNIRAGLIRIFPMRTYSGAYSRTYSRVWNIRMDCLACLLLSIWFLSGEVLSRACARPREGQLGSGSGSLCGAREYRSVYPIRSYFGGQKSYTFCLLHTHTTIYLLFNNSNIDFFVRNT